MLRARRSCYFAGAVAFVAFGCGGNPDAPPGYSTGTTTTSMAASGTSSTGATDTTSGSTGTAAGTSTTGAGGSSGTGSDAGPDAVTSADSGGSGGSSGSTDDGGAATSARCKPDVVWEALARVESVPSADFARFGAISSDELAIAWTVTTGDIFVADRASVIEPFGTPAKVNGSVALAVDRAAMAPTGTSIVAIRDDRKGFLGFERASLTDAWKPSSGLEFTQVRVVFEGGTTVSEPVLGADKKSLYFVLSSPTRSPLFYESRWDGMQASWGLPANLPNVDLQSADGARRRRPTGASADGRTLFFFDEVKNVERAAWRATPTSPFETFRDVGNFPEAAPSSRCDTLYYQSQDASGRGVFAAE